MLGGLQCAALRADLAPKGVAVALPVLQRWNCAKGEVRIFCCFSESEEFNRCWVIFTVVNCHKSIQYLDTSWADRGSSPNNFFISLPVCNEFLFSLPWFVWSLILSGFVQVKSEFTKALKNIFVTSLKCVNVLKLLHTKFQRRCWSSPRTWGCI